MARDVACGFAALALAIVYYVAAAAVPTSLLADEVGADGVPKALAMALGALGVLAAARAVARRYSDAAPAVVAGGRAHWRALGLLALGIGYVVVTPYAGYMLATSAFLFAVAVYAGRAPSLRVAGISVGGGIVLWLMFAKLLGVALPAGMLS